MAEDQQLQIFNASGVNINFEISKNEELVSKGSLEPQGMYNYGPPNVTDFMPREQRYAIRAYLSNDNNSNTIADKPVSEATVSLGQRAVLFQNEGRFAFQVSQIPREGDSLASSSSTAQVPCFVTGTSVLTANGPIAVEHLAIGDTIVTADGEFQPIRWIGSRSYRGMSAPQADRPVRIRGGALADGVPARDLLVSPDHALWLDGLFVAAGHLANGTSIIRGEMIENLTYWHIELDRHALLLAENTPAESFLAVPGVRLGFDGVQALDAGAAAVPYAPRAEVGTELAALRGKLVRRSAQLSGNVNFGPVRAWLDRCEISTNGALHVAGWAQDVAQLDSPVCLDIVVDGRIVAMTVAEEQRADIAAAGVGRGLHGFDLGVGVTLPLGAPHVVEVRRSADGLLICAMAMDTSGAWMPLLAA